MGNKTKETGRKALFIEMNKNNGKIPVMLYNNENRLFCVAYHAGRIANIYLSVSNRDVCNTLTFLCVHVFFRVCMFVH